MSFSGTHLLCPNALLWKEEHWADCFNPSHHRTPVDTTGMINIAAVICNTSTKTPSVAVHIWDSLRLLLFRFCILLHFLQHRSINLCLLPCSEQRDTFAEVMLNGGDVLCQWHTPWAIPARIATFVWDIPVLGLAGRSGWGQEGTESWCSPSQLPRESGTADPCSPHKTFHNIKCLNHKRVINRAVDVQTHSSLCHFHLKQNFVSLELESYYHLFIF